MTDIGTDPYIGYPFLELPLDRLKIEDAKPIFFDAATGLIFFRRLRPVLSRLFHAGQDRAARRRADASPVPRKPGVGLTGRITPGRVRAAALPFPATPLPQG
jgi:hypothetical protein